MVMFSLYIYISPSKYLLHFGGSWGSYNYKIDKFLSQYENSNMCSLSPDQSWCRFGSDHTDHVTSVYSLLVILLMHDTADTVSLS